MAFYSFSTNAILLNWGDVFKFYKNIKTTKTGPKVGAKRLKIGQIRKRVLTSKQSKTKEIN